MSWHRLRQAVPASDDCLGPASLGRSGFSLRAQAYRVLGLRAEASADQARVRAVNRR
jgi:hypothetical protein